MRTWFKSIFPAFLAAMLLLPPGDLTPQAHAESAAAAADSITVFHETFANGKGAAVPSGGATLTPVTGKAFAGNEDGAALYVGNRKNNWDAADFRFADLGLQNGQTYTVTVSLYVDADAAIPSGAQAFLQTVNSYGWLAGAKYTAGGALTLTKEFTVDTGKDTALRVQSNTEGASVPFYIGDLLIVKKADTTPTDPDRPPALPFTPVTFEDQTSGGFAPRGSTEKLTVTNEANHTANGAYALKVEGRTQNWNGPSLRVEKYVDKGYEYRITAWVKLISPDSSQLQLATQIAQDSGANYVSLAAKTVSTGDGWVELQGTYRYNNVSSEYLTVYVESSSNATASFYIDDIRFESTGSGPITIQKDLTPVKTAYKDDFLIGNAITAEDLQGVRLDLLKLHHNIATAGNAMKPDALQPSKGNFTFTAADSMVNQVLAAGMKMHGHVLVWHQQSPAWLNTATDAQGGTVPLSRDEALTNLRTHIRTVMEHFGGKVFSWDVVNEAMSDNPSAPADYRASLRKSPWYQAIGPDYVEQAFLTARAVLDEHPEWSVKLYYNDYNEDNQNKATAIYNMVKDLNDRYAQSHPGKLLVDGVGMQAHYSLSTNPENVKLSLEKFLSLGVTISITELDIQAGSNYTMTDKQAAAQGYLYAQLMKLFKAHADRIERVTFWGMDDNTSWRASSNPCLFDKGLQAKLAYYGVIDPEKYMAEHVPESRTALVSQAAYGTPVIDGAADTVWERAPAMPVNRYQMAWQGAAGTARALWDDHNLYILVQVTDSQLNKSNANAWEQDSVEIFLDPNNGKTSYYQDDDGQYRISYDNATTFNPAALSNGFVSATQVTGTSYTVEAKIPLSAITPVNEAKVGFDVQINDAKDGSRISVAAWNDTTGTGYMDTSVYGVLLLTGKPPADTVPPVTTIQHAPAGWQTQPVDITLQASDAGSGVAATYYSLDGTAYRTGSSLRIDTEGIHTLRFYSVDLAGNREAEQETTISLDLTGPAVTIPELTRVLISDGLRPLISATDASSGVDTLTVTLDGSPIDNPVELPPLGLSLGEHTLAATASDLAGHSTTVTRSFTVYMDAAHLDALFQAGFDNGYLKKPQLLNSLLAKVKQVQAAGDDAKKARNALNALRHEVRAQSGKGLDAVYAALVLNILQSIGK
ncbi:endo-1,4-beta-xylanase [Gorillibacterium sp. sgz5001074]|uniref:endo-1,4-beta-xylanase n=1 Tax=Gorillibacterium sp. sgz5001074 TaxID=3446695 RepID=UPI003F673A6E